ncbi:MAG TPA: radical SAM family heme chaperone HemW [Xanthobacteraceae bacterium]|nr:radical SAM family heme chaperone HemW [Xanthobacteraceae bacterium]
MAKAAVLARREGDGDADDPGFGIYVHWPFCLSKCPYCDFNSHVRHEKPDEARYLRAINAELADAAATTGRRAVRSIFFGGGTPSLMQPATVGAILDAIAWHWPLEPDAEITLEANPSSVEAERFRGYRAAGVNRVSLGLQSLENDALKFLGRLHSAEEALAAVSIARANFPRISFDLIYARPGQTPAAWRAELARALAEESEHLSLYQLTIEDDTPFSALYRNGRLKIPNEEQARALWDVTQETCEARGLPAYEISNHARPGAACRHNLVYWRYGDYVGVGPGAHGRIGKGKTRHATMTEKNPEQWLALVERTGRGRIVDDPLSESEQADELLLMGLRLREGIALARYASLAGRALDPARIAALEKEGLVETRGGRLRATASGFVVLDAIVADLAA